MGSWKKMIIGEPMPDKNDPKYKERYERDFAAGQKFAFFLRLDKLGEKLQRYGQSNTKMFFAYCFAFILFLCIVSFSERAYKVRTRHFSPEVTKIDSIVNHSTHIKDIHAKK